MPVDPRTTAIDSLRQLRDCLTRAAGDLSGCVDQTEQLISAVESSHLEAVRFRLFGLRRELTLRDDPAPNEVTRLLEEVSAALQQAGFRT